jgi:hypothetical protein
MTFAPFWDKLVEIEEIKIKINDHDLKDEEKKELVAIVYQTLDIRVVEIVLSSLPKEKHQSFLDLFSQKTSRFELMAFLKEEIEDIEEKIEDLVREVKKEVLKQLR